jgi:hypothetical protein
VVLVEVNARKWLLLAHFPTYCDDLHITDKRASQKLD